MIPEITIKITMLPDGVRVSQDQPSNSTEEFSVPVLVNEAKLDETYAVPSLPDDETDVMGDYSIPSIPNESSMKMDDEYLIPAVPDIQEADSEDEYSIPVIEEDTGDGIDTELPH